MSEGNKTQSTTMRIVGYVGRVLLSAGVLLLAFVAYELWGTGLHEAKAQDALAHEFDAALAAEAPPTTSAPSTSVDAGPPTTGTTTTRRTEPETVKSIQLTSEIGAPVGRIEIPKLNVTKIFVQGISLEQLNRAPGHYPQTPFPGQAGNASIAGHRSTYGAPFYNIDKLKPGDEIHIQTLQGRFTYAVEWSKITDPYAMWVLDDEYEGEGDDKVLRNTLTLTACHPRMDLTHRYIVRAVLQGDPVPTPPAQKEQMVKAAKTSNALADGVTAAAHPEAWPPTILFGLLCALIWLAAWWGSRRWRGGEVSNPPRWARTVLPYVVGVPVFGLTLFVFFENLSRILPAGI